MESRERTHGGHNTEETGRNTLNFFLNLLFAR